MVTAIVEDSFTYCDELSISGYEGSYAQKYADLNHIAFSPLSNEEHLPDLPIPEVTFAENTSYWYFDIDTRTYVDKATIYVGIYDTENKLLEIHFCDMDANDATTISVKKNMQGIYAKIFEWATLDMVTQSQKIALSN